MQRKTSRPWLGAVISAGALAFGLALLVYAGLGLFSRYYADDFCLTSSFLSSGFWKSQVVLYTTWSPRFSGTFLINLSELFGRTTIRLWTAFVIVLWVAGLTWALLQARRATGLPGHAGLALLLAEALVFFTILEAPQQYQSVYWRVGIVTYTLPLALLAWLAGLTFNRAGKASPGRVGWGGAAACAGLAFFAGGFSETYVALQTGLLVLALAGVWLGVKGPLRRSWRTLVGAALAGSLLALIVVVVAPGNAVRLSAMPARPAPIAFLRMMLTNAFLFVYTSLRDYSFQNVLALLIPLAISYSLFAREGALPRMQPAALTLALFSIPVVGCLLVLAVCAPSAYAEASIPDPRVLIEARFVLVAATLAEGALIGMSFSQLHRWAGEPAPLFLQIFTAAVFLLAALYPVYDAYKSYRQLPVYRQRAAAWEAHDAAVRADLGQGVLNVKLYDGQARSFDPFSGLLDLSSDPTSWVNQCAAGYYGAHTLSMNQP